MLRLWTKPTADPPGFQICTALLQDLHSSTSACQPLPCAFAQPCAGLVPLQDRCAGRRPACAPASPREGAMVAHGGSQVDNTAFHPLPSVLSSFTSYLPGFPDLLRNKPPPPKAFTRTPSGGAPSPQETCVGPMPPTRCSGQEQERVWGDRPIGRLGSQQWPGKVILLWEALPLPVSKQRDENQKETVGYGLTPNLNS